MYVLPYGQMSLWGYLKLAPHVYLLISNYIHLEDCQEIIFYVGNLTVALNLKGWPLGLSLANEEKSKRRDSFFSIFSFMNSLASAFCFLKAKAVHKKQRLANEKKNNKNKNEAVVTSLISNINYRNQDFMQKANLKGKELKKIRANLRIGPHNKDILSILFGSLLGDAHAEFRLKGNGTRITFYQEGSHVSYLIWLHKLISELGYCNTNLPKITTRLGQKGVVRKIIRFKT